MRRDLPKRGVRVTGLHKASSMHLLSNGSVRVITCLCFTLCVMSDCDSLVETVDWTNFCVELGKKT